MSPIDPFLTRRRIAHFSMKIALRPEMHTYSGGLGVLAGDTARSCANLELPMLFLTLASRPWLHVLTCPIGPAVPVLLLGDGANKPDLFR